MNVVAMCTLSTGLSAIRFALDMGVKITKVIGLDGAHNRDKDAITGVVDISKFCTSKNLDFDYVSDYSLKKESTKILGKESLTMGPFHVYLKSIKPKLKSFLESFK